MVTAQPWPTGGNSNSADFETYTNFDADIILNSVGRPAGAQRGLVVTTARQNEGTLIVVPRDNPTENVPVALARNISIYIPIQVIAIRASGTENITDVLALF